MIGIHNAPDKDVLIIALDSATPEHYGLPPGPVPGEAQGWARLPGLVYSTLVGYLLLLMGKIKRG